MKKIRTLQVVINSVFGTSFCRSELKDFFKIPVDTMIVFWLIFIYFAVYYFLEYLEKRSSPPGPLPIPIFGNLLQLAAASPIPSLAFSKFADEYGEIFQLRMGMKTMVVTASLEAITTTFLCPETYGRDHTGSWHDRNFQKNLGIVFGDGPIWEKTKAWTSKVLKDYGFGKASTLEASIYGELDIFLREVEKIRVNNNNIVPVENLFIISMVKLVWQMITGHCTAEDEVVIARLVEKSELALRKGVFGAGIVTAFPISRFIIPETTGHAAQMAFYEDAHITARGMLKESRSEMAKQKDKYYKPQNLVEEFVIKMEEEKNDPNTMFTEENFIVIFMDILQGTSDTTSSFLECLMLFLSLYPDIQAKVFREIEQHLSSVREPSFDSRKNLLYTQACMLEAHRHTRVVQNLVPRRVLKNFYYKNYLIKKGTLMVANLRSAYNSEKHWDDPLEFKPERFIGHDGNIIRENDITPFGLGKRRCPGESHANIFAFLYLVSMLRKYKVSTVPGEPRPRDDMQEGFTSKPYPFEILLTERS